jgi:hypothetical protein
VYAAQIGLGLAVNENRYSLRESLLAVHEFACQPGNQTHRKRMKYITQSLIPLTLSRLFVLLAALFGLALASRAQTRVFTEDWETDHSFDNTYRTNYTTGGANLAVLYFDYSTVGIPQSPNSTGPGTHGLKMCANIDPALQVFPSGVSVSPVGFGITENFDMHFDYWGNFNGPAPGGGSGSTQVGGAGYGTFGTNAQVAGIADSVYIGATADGGSSVDYRVYSPNHFVSYQDGDFRIGSGTGPNPVGHGDPSSGYVYAGTNRNNTGGYYDVKFPGQSIPAAQTALYPQQTGTAANGSQGFKWHDVSLSKIANVITYKIDNILIATVDVVDAGVSGGTNILFNHYDINAGASTDPNFTNLNFTLIDNVRITNFPNVVSVSVPGTNAIYEGGTAGANKGTFVITRTSAGQPITVSYTMTGVAQNGVDYTNASGGALSGSVTFSANATTTNIDVYAVDDSIPELTENIVLNVDPSPNYTGAGNATIRIVDNEPPVLTITNLDTQMFERTNDFARFQITRLGSTNMASFPINLSFGGGTAVYGTDFYTNTIATFEPGMATTNVSILPIEDGVYEGNETAVVHIAPAGAGEYTIGSANSASITIVDADSPPETVLFQDNFNTDSSGNWTLAFADTNSPSGSGGDYTAIFGYDYSGQNIPAAPHSGGDTHGLFLTVNKDATPGAAALNLYPIGQSFSGNFALKFDMFLDMISGNTSTEYALFGINHSGTKTNWWRSGGVPAGWTFDGIFYAVETDAQSVPNFVNYSSPNTGTNPTALSAGVNATNFTSVFKSPPWAVAGSPAMNITSNTPVWSEVELSKVGNTVTLRINKTTILSTENGTGYNSGNIMLGYEDAFDSIGPIQSYVIYDNVRVVALASQPVITSITKVGSNTQIDFTAAGGTASQFHLLTASAVGGPYTDTGASITSLGGGAFRTTQPFNALSTAVFYRIAGDY